MEDELSGNPIRLQNSLNILKDQLEVNGLLSYHGEVNSLGCL